MSRFRPVVSRRVPASSHFAELFLAPGPVSIGATGDNSFEVLFGRNWLLVWDRDDGHLHLWQEQPGGVWLEVTADLPPVFASPAPSGSRRWSLAFDQSARVILAYEGADGIVRVTRWDAGSGQYVQNVSFAAVDPVLFMDASLADLALSADAGLRQAAEFGWSAALKWAPTGQWLDNVLVDSDVVIFYLSADRLELRARVQRELYLTEHVLHTFGEPAVLDRVVALFGHYEALVSTAAGEARSDMLLSAPYIEDVVLRYATGEAVAATVAPEDVAAVGLLYNVVDGDALIAAVEPEDIGVVGSLLIVASVETVEASIGVEDVVVVGNVYLAQVTEELSVGVAVEDMSSVVVVSAADAADDLTGGVGVEDIRVRTV